MPTRTILFHITGLQQALFYSLAALATGVCLWGVLRRWKLWRQGSECDPIRWQPGRGKALLNFVIGQRKLIRRPFAGVMHCMLFYGMLVLFIGTVVVGVEHYGAYLFKEGWFYRGAFYLLMKAALDLFGLGVLIATGMALARRLAAKPGNLGHGKWDAPFLALLFTATLTGFLLEGAGISADPKRAPYAAFSPIGGAVASIIPGVSASTYIVLWWIHIPLVLGVIAALPYGRWLHLFVIPVTIASAPKRAIGQLAKGSLEQVEATGKIGAATLADLSKWSLMSLDGCMECGRCSDVCPALAATKPLNPKQVVGDLRALLSGKGGAGSTDVIQDDAVWACTNCHACVLECPAHIHHVDLINGIRQFRVAEGRLSGSAATTLRQLGSRENPWGLPASQRMDWAKGLDIPLAAQDDNRDVLLWVGCAGAFEPRAQKTVRAVVKLLQHAGLRVTVLGPKERCTGDPARRIGDEFLFQQLAESNVGTLKSLDANRVITTCPHCLNTLKNEYRDFGIELNVEHHSESLARLLATGKLTVKQAVKQSTVYHDPCFLARVNGVHQAPRDVLAAAVGMTVVEADRNRDRTFCCGAGGGRMWMEDAPDQRPNLIRARELLATKAERVAVGCPFCKVMIGDGVGLHGGESAPPVVDLAEALLEAVGLADTKTEDASSSAV